MTQPVLVPFEPWHAHLLKARKDSEMKALEMAGELDHFSLVYAQSSLLAFTGLVGGYCIGMGGVFPLWPGTAECWLFSSDHFDKYPKFVFKMARQVLDLADNHFEIHRLQASVRADADVNRRFIERLGFKNEGIMEKYGIHGEDYIRYARIK